MTQPPTRHAALERYLTLATWGLWGSNKHTLRLELESHVRHKAWKYQVQGLNEHDAIQKALEDLGQAQTICAGMNGVYTMPNMIRQTFLAGILMSLGVAGFSSSAQIATLQRLPIEPCLNSTSKEIKKANVTIYCNSDELWVKKTDLAAMLKPQGVTFKNDTFVFPPNNPTGLDRYGEGVQFANDTKLYKYSEDYINLADFVAGLYNTRLPVSIIGWKNPRVDVGEVEFSLGDTTSQFPADSFYWGLVSKSMMNNFGNKRHGVGRRNSQVTYLSNLLTSPPPRMYPMTVVDQPEQVYMLLTIDKGTNFEAVMVNVQATNDRGRLNFLLDNTKIKLVSNFEQLKASEYGQPITALLVKLKTNIEKSKYPFEVVDPASVLVQESERPISATATPAMHCETRGGIDLSLQGKWTGTFTATDVSGKRQSGALKNTMDKRGLVSGTIINNDLQYVANVIGTTCNNGEILNTYSYDLQTVFTSKGKITKQPDGSLRGQSEEFENDKLISKTEFVLRRK